MKKMLFLLLTLCATFTYGDALVRDKENKAVQITVYNENKERKIAVVPESFQLPKNRKLRFLAFNNLDEIVDRIEVVFKSGSPLNGDLVIDRLEPGDADGSKFRGVKGDVPEGTQHKYTIKVFVQGVSEPLVLDPQIEIVGVR